MNLQNIISQGLAHYSEIKEIDSGVRVKTHCIYPSNSTVMVSVRGGPNKYIAMDDGAALGEAILAGADITGALKKYEKICHRQGLLFSNGVVRSPEIDVSALPAAIILVANTSKEVADHIFLSWKAAKVRDFKESVKLLLSKTFPTARVAEGIFSGESSKVHSFDSVIHTDSGMRIIVDPVLRDASSINSRVIAHLDLKKARHDGVEQRLIFDDQEEKWQSSELSVLQLSGVPVVPFSKMPHDIENLLKAA